MGQDERQREATPAGVSAPTRILFVLNSLGYLRFFDAVIRGLLDRGDVVRLVVERPDHEPNEEAWLEEMAARPNFSFGITRALATDRWRGVATKLRRSSDYLRFAGLEFRDAPHLVARARGRAPERFLRVAGSPLFRGERGRRFLLRTLLQLERAVPSSPLVEREIAEHGTDVLVLSPHLMPGARHSEYVKSARALGVPTCVCIASWDNLSSKQLLREMPDRLVVWNDVQRQEARTIHGVPADRIVVTGAQGFDLWFDWKPRPRAGFAARVGLDPERPFVLYLGGSLFPGTLTEAEWMRDTWLPAVRSRPGLADVQVLARPHPSRGPEWASSGLERIPGVAMWPRGGNEMPVDDASRSDFFDSISHCEVVVGLNTSAMIEAAIVDRPVLALLVPEFVDSQMGTFHFDYLLSVGDGLVQLAGSLDEHVVQLDEALAVGPNQATERNRRFVEFFVRPHGLDCPATPLVLDAIESLAGTPTHAHAADQWRLAPIRAGLAAYIYAKALRWKLGRLFSIAAPLNHRAELSQGPADTSGERPLRILLSMWSVNYDRLFEAALRELLHRGHEVEIVFETDKDGLSGGTSLFEELRDAGGALTWSVAPLRSQPVRAWWRRQLRLTLDLLRYYEPAFASAEALRERARGRAPRVVSRLARTPAIRSATVRHGVAALARRLERALAPDPAVVDLLRARRPDVVVATPLVMLGSAQSEYLRAARALGIPTAFPVASWDNLTNKGLVHDEPDLTIVWNEAQRTEAIDLHGLPHGRIVVTGAHSYDHWFDWRPRRSRDELCAELGLDPGRPIVLYACSSPFIAPHEVQSVSRWLNMVRASAHPLLRDASVIVRPHPANEQPWQAESIEQPGRTIVWPPRGAKPTEEQAKQDYYDTLFHADAVVGINTSALVESAIVGRPSYTLLEPELVGAQEETLHFAHLTALHVARTPEAHARQLLEALQGDSDDSGTRTFVESFLRPRGVELCAAPLLADELEALAERRQTILFALDHPGFLLHFDETVRELAARGNRVHVAFLRPDKWPHGLEALAQAPRVFVHDHAPRRDTTPRAARAIRRLADYVHYLDPALADAVYARRKWRDLAPLAGPLRRVDTLPRPLVRALLGALALAERLLPAEAAVDRFVSGIAPDAIVVSPLVDARTDLADYVASGRRLNVPTALAVASWDNLSSKGLVRLSPHRVFVWNETQRREAVEYHHLRDRRVTITGAQSYDRWFGRTPSEPFADFTARRGLEGVERFLLFAGSTKQGQAPELEPTFVRRWIDLLRANDELRDVGVLIRPHPTNADAWRDVNFDDVHVAVWRRARDLPIADDDRSSYYDALRYSAAVVAINSTALIEATILDRPAHTVALAEFRELQHDLLHYHYLLQVNGGFLREARSLEEHIRLLAEDVREPERGAELRRRFVESFIRPAGIGVPATPRLIDGIERLARYR